VKEVNTPVDPATEAVAHDFSTHAEVTGFQIQIGKPSTATSQLFKDFLAAQVVGKSIHPAAVAGLPVGFAETHLWSG
jgi:hypothetical protein